MLRHPRLAQVAGTHGVTPAQAVFAYCLQRGMTVLTGTTDPHHMEQDLAAADIVLASDELTAIDALVG